MFYDAHNHLQDDWLAPHLDRIAACADDLPIASMVVNGTCEADWPQVSALARRLTFVRPSYGLHPWHVGNRSANWLETLRARLAAEPTAAIGEIGIDRWIIDGARSEDERLAGLRRAPMEEQIEVFLPQLALATAENRPVTIHCLQAWGALEKLLRSHALPARGFLLHAYGGPVGMIETFTRLGAYFSFNGYFLDPRKTKHLDAFKKVPPDRLLIETDAPAMPLPQPWRTHKLPPAPSGAPVNHPANIEAAYTALASLLGVPLKSLAQQTEANFRRFFTD